MSDPTPSKPTRKLTIALTIDFDALSAWLGTGAHPHNNTADYSAGYFAAYTGVPRLLRLLRKLHLSDRATWCIPGHSIETFPTQTRAIVASGAEIALHGYAHEGAGQLTAQQEVDVVRKCVGLVTELTGGRRPVGWRAPLYQLSERTIGVLQREGFEWDSSLGHWDAKPYFLPKDPAPVEAIEFGEGREAAEWMKPSPRFEELVKSRLVEIPGGWYQEDATPLQFYPSNPTTHGYVDVRVVERMWQDRFNFLLAEMADEEAEAEARAAGEAEQASSQTPADKVHDELKVFTLILHPDTAGMAHVVGMVERFLRWVLAHGEEAVEFRTCGEIAREFRRREEGGKEEGEGEEVLVVSKGMDV